MRRRNFGSRKTRIRTPLPICRGGRCFKDPMLQGLIRTALTNNYDLKQAVARVEQARYQASAASSAFFPQVNYGADVGRGRNAYYNSPANLGGATKSSAIVNLSAFWEIDFWGRIRRSSEAARAQYLATDEARRSLTITLMSEVAITYFQLLDLDQELEIQRSATNAYAGSYRIFNDRLTQGRRFQIGNRPRRRRDGECGSVHSQLGIADCPDRKPAQHFIGPQSRPGAAAKTFRPDSGTHQKFLRACPAP